MIVAVINNKGGVGKTTSAVNLSAAWAHAGKSTLLVDLDSQCSASLHLGQRAGKTKSTVTDLFCGKTPSPQPTSIDGLSLLAGSVETGAWQMESKPRRQEPTQVLGRALQQLAGKYQRIVLDCPPALSFVTVSAVVGAESLLIPVTPSYLAVEGLIQFLGALQRLGSPRSLAILLTMVDCRMRLTGEVVEMVRNHYREQVLRTEIKVNVKLAEASSFGQSIFEYDPRCPGAKLYREVMNELEARCLAPAAVA